MAAASGAADEMRALRQKLPGQPRAESEWDRPPSVSAATAPNVPALRHCPPVAAKHFIERARTIAESLELGIATRLAFVEGRASAD